VSVFNVVGDVSAIATRRILSTRTADKPRYGQIYIFMIVKSLSFRTSENCVSSVLTITAQATKINPYTPKYKMYTKFNEQRVLKRYRLICSDSF
jgi:hypothetical protein